MPSKDGTTQYVCVCVCVCVCVRDDLFDLPVIVGADLNNTPDWKCNPNAALGARSRRCADNGALVG
jgi:hypothetical protein